MNYYARSENANGQMETVQHHLQRTAELCSQYASAFDCADCGIWMGLLHDFGKYSQSFQAVLLHQLVHIDHALPGAAFLCEKLCGKETASSKFWPMSVAIRCHHGKLQYDYTAELKAWKCTKDNSCKSSSGNSYSLLPFQIPAALQVFLRENTLPRQKPMLPQFAKCSSLYDFNQQKMLFTRMLFSCLTDADYSASAEHFDPNYLVNTSLPLIDPAGTWDALEKYRARLSCASKADPAINRLRNELYQYCQSAGECSSSGLYTLTAPTGTGKTLAMLAFGLMQMIHQHKKRIIIVLPYLSIIEQNAAVYQNIIPDILEDHSQAERNTPADQEISQRWDAPFIITTSVKFFESLFACSGPACRKLHRLANSVILFDEAQSLPVHLVTATLSALRELAFSYHSTIVFSTATQPDFNQLPDLEWLPHEIVPNPQQMFSKARRATSCWRLDSPLSLYSVAQEAAQNPDACIIVNLRRHAQIAYGALRSFCPENSVFMMTTDLCPAHRTRILSTIKDRLQQKLPCYLVATQCIEAGVDISFSTLYRALAPLESIIQAAGRCNRNDTRRRGMFFVFIPDEEKLYPDDFYQQASNAVLTLSARHEIDLYSLSDIHEYYEILYGNGCIHDKSALQRAIESMDFEGVSREYKLIDDNQIQILVPCPGCEDQVRELAEKARNGITSGWIRRAAPFTVHSYNRKFAADCCEEFFVRAGREKLACGWYFLSNPDYYDPACGLQTSVSFDGII